MIFEYELNRSLGLVSRVRSWYCSVRGTEHVDDKEEARGRGEEREEGPNPSATAPIPGQRPATPRRVSFANAEQVCSINVLDDICRTMCVLCSLILVRGYGPDIPRTVL